jgi:hypothetical protein
MDCSYLARQDWIYSAVNYHKSGDGTGLIRVHVGDTFWEADLPADKEETITIETLLHFYKDSNNYESHASLSQDTHVTLREKITRRNYTSSKSGVSFFFYFKNVQSEQLHVSSL